MHCIVEQAVLHSVCNTNSENMYWKEEKKRVQGYLNERFIKLGQKMSSSDGTKECVADNSGSRDDQRQTETNYRDGSLVTEDSFADSKVPTKSAKIFDYPDLLQIMHEFDTVGKIRWMAHSTCLQPKTLTDVIRITSHFAELISAPGKGSCGC